MTNVFSFAAVSRVNATLALVGGIGLLVAPDLLLQLLGIPLTFAAEFYGRAYATGLINIGLISWMTRDVTERNVTAGVTAANTTQDALIVAILLHAMWTGRANGWTWGLVAAFGYQAIANGLVWRAERRRDG